MAKKVAVLQIDSVLGDQWANLAKIDRMIAQLNDPEVRLAAFCEYGLSGYCTDLMKIAEPIPGKITDALCEISKRHNIWITGGLPEKVSETQLANSMVMISPKDGLVANYRKIHPFSSERSVVVFGEEPVVVDTEAGRVGLSICYDFVFPEFIRGLRLKGAEIIVNSTFWYADDFSTALGWGPSQVLAMSRVRAMENKCYVMMACRTGTERKGTNVMHGFGHSSISDPMGCIIAQAELGEKAIKAEIDLDYLANCNKIGYVNDRRPEIYKKMFDF
jgi:predicted amidohydrolase